MRKLFSSIIPWLGLSLVVAGCAGPEQKLGRGINNLTEFTTLGEMRRSIEQETVLVNRSQGYTTGVFHGFDRTLARTAAGIYEVATFPFPNRSPKDYGPVFYPAKPGQSRQLQTQLVFRSNDLAGHGPGLWRRGHGAVYPGLPIPRLRSIAGGLGTAG